jgi:capsular polysaccharide biosynthesis protein
LEGFEYYRNQTDIDPKLIIPADATDWMLDALCAMGYGPEWWVPWSGGRMAVNNLVVSAVRRENRDPNVSRRLLYSPTEFRWIRDRVFDNIKSEKTRSHADRIFISRKNATVRRLKNEDELMDMLSGRGFKRYHLEDLSFAEQVTLFSEAEAIISTHGSGLLNQIWADDATVIEIFGPKHSITDPAIEYYIADLLGHEYGCVQGDAVGVDTQVDVSNVEMILKMMLEN